MFSEVNESRGETKILRARRLYGLFRNIKFGWRNVSFGDYFARPSLPKYRRTEPDFKLNQRLFRADKIRLLITPYWGDNQ